MTLKTGFQEFSNSREYEHGYLFKIKVITLVDSSPTNTERLRLIPVSSRRIIRLNPKRLAPCTIAGFHTVRAWV